MNQFSIFSIVLTTFVAFQYEVTAKPSLRIINGTTAEEGEFPYMVQLLVSNQFECGGSIIGSEWILTAGHCVNSGMIGTIIYGTTKTFDEGDDPQPGTAIKVKKYFQHPDYKHVLSVPIYDVGLLQLEQPILFSETVQPIKIAEETDEVPFHVDGVLSGWGYIDDWLFKPEFLQKITRQFLTDEECIKIIDGYMNDTIFLPVHHLCTNDHYDGEAHGDSGSPLVINGTQFALSSWSVGPGRVPGAYTRITNSEYRKWIRNITNI